MSDAERCRERATRLLAMALRACEYGDMEFAQRLMARATEFFDVAGMTAAADRTCEPTTQNLPNDPDQSG